MTRTEMIEALESWLSLHSRYVKHRYIASHEDDFGETIWTVEVFYKDDGDPGTDHGWLEEKYAERFDPIDGVMRFECFSSEAM